MNTEMILLGFGLLGFIFVWNVMVKRTVLDHFRDKLFDLRDSFKEQSIDEGVNLQESLCVELRELINNQIRFLESASIMELITFKVEIDRDKDLNNFILKKNEKRFHSEYPKTRDYITSVRLQAFTYTSGYIIHTSLSLCCLTYILMFSILPFIWWYESFKLSMTVFKKARSSIQIFRIDRDLIEEISSLKSA